MDHANKDAIDAAWKQAKREREEKKAALAAQREARRVQMEEFTAMKAVRKKWADELGTEVRKEIINVSATRKMSQMKERLPKPLGEVRRDWAVGQGWGMGRLEGRRDRAGRIGGGELRGACVRGCRAAFAGSAKGARGTITTRAGARNARACLAACSSSNATCPSSNSRASGRSGLPHSRRSDGTTRRSTKTSPERGRARRARAARTERQGGESERWGRAEPILEWARRAAEAAAATSGDCCEMARCAAGWVNAIAGQAEEWRRGCGRGGGGAAARSARNSPVLAYVRAVCSMWVRDGEVVWSVSGEQYACSTLKPR